MHQARLSAAVALHTLAAGFNWIQLILVASLSLLQQKATKSLWTRKLTCRLQMVCFKPTQTWLNQNGTRSTHWNFSSSSEFHLFRGQHNDRWNRFLLLLKKFKEFIAQSVSQIYSCRISLKWKMSQDKLQKCRWKLMAPKPRQHVLWTPLQKILRENQRIRGSFSRVQEYLHANRPLRISNNFCWKQSHGVFWR